MSGEAGPALHAGRAVRRFVSLAITGLLACAGMAGAQEGGSIPLDEAGGHAVANPGVVDAIVDGYIEQGALPFLYVRLEDGAGRVLYEHSVRNPALMPYAVDGDSWVRIWSMSKIVTITTALDLVEAGVLSLDDPIDQYIPEFEALRVAVGRDGQDLVSSDPETRGDVCPVQLKPLERRITVRDLINHTDGFYYSWNGIACIDEPFKDALLATAQNSDELISKLAKLPLINQPGTEEHYGAGTTVLGLVVERATGQSLPDVVAERVTGPLGITGLRYGLPKGEVLPPRFSGDGGTLARARPGELDIFGDEVPFYDLDRQLFLGGEGMIGTAAGYATFARMLLHEGSLAGHRLLEPGTVADITAPHTQTESEWGYNGYNLWISNGRLSTGEFGPAPLWVGGGYEGTQFWIDPVNDLVGIILTQIHDMPAGAANSTESIRMALYDQLGWVAPPQDASLGSDSRGSSSVASRYENPLNTASE